MGDPGKRQKFGGKKVVDDVDVGFLRLDVSKKSSPHFTMTALLNGDFNFTARAREKMFRIRNQICASDIRNNSL